MQTLFLLLCSFTTLLAADLSGQWGGNLDSPLPNGRIYSGFIYLDLTQDGQRVVGKVGEGELKAWAVENGQIQGDKLTFEAHPTDVQIVKFSLSFAANRLIGDAVADRNGTEMRMKVNALRNGPVYWYIHGNALADGKPAPATGRYQDAIESYKKAISLDPNLVVAYVELGRLYLDGDHAGEALEPLKKAISLAKDYRSAYTHLAAAYRKLGRDAEAEQIVAQLRTVIADHPSTSPQ